MLSDVGLALVLNLQGLDRLRSKNCRVWIGIEVVGFELAFVF